MSVTSSKSTILSPSSQKQDMECVMHSSQCTQLQSSVGSRSSQFDKCADISFVNCVPDSEALPKELSATEGLFLRKVSKLIANGKWHELDLVLWSSSNDTTGCAYAHADIGNAGDDDVMSSLNIGKGRKNYYSLVM